ncbi:MAG: DUF2203 domain-containing protein [Terriglobales bacterium]
MAKKTFSLDEAHTMLPVLRSLLQRGMDAKKQIEDIEAEFQAVQHQVLLKGGCELDIVKLARRRAESDKAVQTVKDTLAEIDATGAQVKDLDIGLLDFPCSVDGEIVLLCWKIDETKITHWHGTDEGFANRKPIDERIARAKGSKPN